MNQPDAHSVPWWHYGHVWLVVAGPAIVVVAGFITLWLALRAPDPLVRRDDHPPGARVSARHSGKALMPAEQGRNHAATPRP